MFWHADKALSSGKVVIDVAYFGFHVYGQTGDLCAETSCPIPAGDFTISYSQLLPTYAPPVSGETWMTDFKMISVLSS